MNRWLLILTLCSLLIISCSKDEKIINHAPEADFEYLDDIDKFRLISTANDVDEDVLNYDWISLSSLVSVDNSQGKIAYIDIPDINETSEIAIKHIVFDGEFDDTIIKNIQLPILTEIRKWGLGCTLEKEHSNNVDYEWYIDQMNTGIYNDVNCGPTTVTMAVKWYNKDFSGTPEDARNTYRIDGGWWYTEDIINYLNKYSVNNRIIGLENTDSLVNEVDNGNIIILCLDMFYISDSYNDKWHIDKFYITDAIGWGHFFVIKGYKKVDNQIFFEVYDPYSYGERYIDNVLKGKDRYYQCDEIDEATNKWWDYAIIISKDKTNSSDGLNVNNIKHNYGF